MPNKYLLTGGRGTLGTELQKYLKCFAPSSSALDIVSFRDDWADFGLSRGGPVREFVNTHGKDLVDVTCLIHCAAWTDVPGAEIDKSAAVNTNIIGTQNMAKFAYEQGWRFVYISTDYVYPGHVGNYNEESKTEPFNFYGFTKLAGESFVDLNTDLIIRTSFKPSDLWETKYNKAFIDIYSSTDYVDNIAKDIAFAIHSNLNGVYNIGTERKSIFELAQSRFPSVEELSRWDVYNIKLPSDISMDVSKYNRFKEKSKEEFNRFIGGK